MFIEEKAHFSLIYKLKDELTKINIIDSFPTADLVVPTVAVNLVSVDFTKLEIGNYNNIRELNWILDIFAQTKEQRNYIMFNLFSILEKKVPIYDYDEGFPPTTVPQIGAISPVKLHIEMADVVTKNPEEMLYRSIGTFVATIETY